MELSIIIVSYNVRHFLEQCLISVRKASINIDCEIFVVDNNSGDDSCSMVEHFFPEVILIRNKKNSGFAVANNQAIKLSAGKFILLLNPDTIVDEGTFIKCIGFMNDHIDAGSVGVKMIDGKGRYLPESKRALPTPEVAFFKVFGFACIFPDSPKFNKYYMGFLDKDETNPVEILTGAFMFIRREALDKAGFLDENFFMYGEDIDLSYRLIKSGYRNYYFPGVTIIHYKGQSTKKDNINYVINFYRAMLIFLMKHFNPEGKRIYYTLINSAVWFRAFLSILKRIIVSIILPPVRYSLHITGYEKNGNPFMKSNKTVIVANENEYRILKEKIRKSNSRYNVAGRLSITANDTGNDSLGTLTHIKEIIRINRIRAVIFNGGELNASQIIKAMTDLEKVNIEMRIASKNSDYLLGSK